MCSAAQPLGRPLRRALVARPVVIGLGHRLLEMNAPSLAALQTAEPLDRLRRHDGEDVRAPARRTAGTFWVPHDGTEGAPDDMQNPRTRLYRAPDVGSSGRYSALQPRAYPANQQEEDREQRVHAADDDRLRAGGPVLQTCVTVTEEVGKKYAVGHPRCWCDELRVEPRVDGAGHEIPRGAHGKWLAAIRSAISVR